MIEEPVIAFLCFGVIIGIPLFINGFRCLRKKRLLENIPTSTIRSLAMGLVELKGEAKKESILTSPLTGIPCVFYKYLIEMFTGGKRSSWKTIAEGDSSDCLFYLDDGTGKIFVSPKDAEVILREHYKFKTGIGKPLPDNLIRFIEKNNITSLKSYVKSYGQAPKWEKYLPNSLIRFMQKDSVSYTGQVRFTEWLITPNTTIYVLGTAKKFSNFLNSRKIKLASRLKELKQNSAKMAEVDLDKDGKISIEEWDLAVNKIEQELLEEELKSRQAQELSDVVIAKGDTEKTFIISDHSEKDAINTLVWQSKIGICSGLNVVLVMPFIVFLLTSCPYSYRPYLFIVIAIVFIGIGVIVNNIVSTTKNLSK